MSWWSRVDQRIVNVVHLGLGFLILFSADLTITNMQKTINSSITAEKPEYNIDGYLALGLVYGVYGISFWLAPSVITIIGYKASLFIGGSFLALYIFTMALEIVWVSYLGVLVSGFGGSLIWVSEAQYLVLNSDSETMPRNTGIFWALYSASIFSGNIYAVIELEGKVQIDRSTRHQLLYTMSVVAFVASVLFLFLRRPPAVQPKKTEGAVEALIKTWSLFCTKDMLVLLVIFVYGGFQQSFGTGVYTSSLGFTKEFGTRAKQLVPLSGLLYGAGDSLGGAISFTVNKIGIQIKRRHVIIFGFFLQALAYIGAFVNLPNSSVFGETDEKGFIKSQVWLGLVCSIFIGFGDSCLNTQIFPLLRDLHPEYPAHTSSLFKFSKSLAIAASFFLSSYMGLRLQLAVMFGLGVLGVISFAYVDIRQSKRKELHTTN